MSLHMDSYSLRVSNSVPVEITWPTTCSSSLSSAVLSLKIILSLWFLPGAGCPILAPFSGARVGEHEPQGGRFRCRIPPPGAPSMPQSLRGMGGKPRTSMRLLSARNPSATAASSSVHPLTRPCQICVLYDQGRASTPARIFLSPLLQINSPVGAQS
jgi:hypothetical protein